ncbi:MAG: hypothetical protein PHN69_06115 [Candidatus Pacebacteria bacterium]|nr:hypothetical protein [Candidatus Paceibacterota bacterium]
MDEIKKFSIDIINTLDMDEDPDFAICRIQALSDGENSHELILPTEVLKRDAQTCLGKFVVAKIDNDIFGDKDFTDHADTEVILGYIPKDANITFTENESGNGIFMEVDVVLSKLYGNGSIDIFRRDGKKEVSCEFTAIYEDDNENVIKSMNIRGITILGSGINASCTGANAKIIKFSEKKADEFYHERFNSYNELKRFSEERKNKMVEKENYVSHTIDTSKEALDMGNWDGNKAKQDLVKEKNYKTLAKKVCLVLKDGWEDREVTKLGYPVMNLKDGKWVYNAEGLKSAQGYAKTHDPEIYNKIVNLRKKLDLVDDKEKENNDKKEGGSAKMENETFAIQGREAWGAVIAQVEKHEGGHVYVDSVEKNKIIFTSKDGVRYDVKATVEVGKDDKTVKAEIDWGSKTKSKDQSNIHKFECGEEHMSDDNDDEDTDDKMDNKDDDKEKMSSDANVDSQAYADMMDIEAKKNRELADKDDIIMKYEKELEELRKFKADVEEEKKMATVNNLLANIKDKVNDEEYAKCEKEGMECKFSEVSAWRNGVLARMAESLLQFSEKEENILRMSFDKDTDEKKSLWDRL